MLPFTWSLQSFQIWPVGYLQFLSTGEIIDGVANERATEIDHHATVLQRGGFRPIIVRVSDVIPKFTFGQRVGFYPQVYKFAFNGIAISQS